jgi:exoribonuclease R
MTDQNDRQQRSILRRIAHRVMLERGLLPDFSPNALVELDGIREPATRAEKSSHDLRNLIWCSIDNDDSRDLDQLTVAEAMPGWTVKILVAIADVDAVVRKQSALDDHARQHDFGLHRCRNISDAARETIDRSYLSQL